MAHIQWGLDCYTGLPEVDLQHQQLFALINRLGDARAQPALIERAFNELRDYVRDHFAVEEQLMVEANVDAAHYVQHRSAHSEFNSRLNQLWQSHCDGSEAAADQLLEFLTGWLRHHILQTDRKMALEIHTRMGTEAPHNMFSHF